MMAGLSTPALLIGLGVLSLCLIAAGLWTMRRPADDSVRRDRMRKMQSGGDAGTDRLRKMVERSAFDNVPVLRTIPVRMRRAGMTLSPNMLVLASALVTSVLFLVLQGLIGAGLASVAAVGVGVFVPTVVISTAARKRADALTRQLPDALDLMKRGLSVGHPLNVTIRNVSSTMPDPIAAEFRVLADQVAYGDSLTDAVEDLAQRIDIEDFHYLSAAVQIQHATGGNLGAMLDTLARVVRGRFAMRRRVSAVSSEGRITAVILSAMPVLMYVGTSLTAPEYYASVKDDPAFWPLCGAIIALVLGNGLMLKKLVSFRV